MDSPSFGDNNSIEMVLSSLKKPQLVDLPSKKKSNQGIN
jgi:hypothetical protein